MSNFMETYGKAIFILVIIAILIAFAHPLGLKIKEYTTTKINDTNTIGSDEIVNVTRPEKPTTAVDQVYCIYYSDGELVVSQNQIEPESGRTVIKQGFYASPTACTNQMTTTRFEGAVMPKSCIYWFGGCNNLTEIKNIENLYTDECTDMQVMFSGCSSLMNLNLNTFNTSKVTNMYCMFINCTSLTNLDIRQWNTSNVRNMNNMFYECTNLNIINGLNQLDMNKVVQMSYMFGRCKNLKSLDLSNLKVHDLQTTTDMFQECTNLITLNLSGWNTTNVTNMMAMFDSCTSLETLNLNGWNTSNVTTMLCMFFSCKSLTNLDISEWDTSNVTNMSAMFYECTNLNTDCSKWNISKVTEHNDFNKNAPNVISPTWK